MGSVKIYVPKCPVDLMQCVPMESANVLQVIPETRKSAALPEKAVETIWTVLPRKFVRSSLLD